MLEVRQLGGADRHRHLAALAALLVDCVEGGASVSFMAGFSQIDAERYFDGIFEDVAAGKRLLLAAFKGSELVGSVQLGMAMPPNQPHRADVAKLLVLRSARGQGMGAHLMQSAEDAARRHGKTLLVLDTVAGGSAEKLYLRLGWNRAGVIPRYAKLPGGAWGDTVIFWKNL